MPHYIRIEGGEYTFMRRYPTDAELDASLRGAITIIWLEQDPGRAEVTTKDGWKRMEEEK